MWAGFASLTNREPYSNAYEKKVTAPTGIYFWDFQLENLDRFSLCFKDSKGVSCQQIQMQMPDLVKLKKAEKIRRILCLQDKLGAIENVTIM